MYKIPIILLIVFLILLAVNIPLFVLDYKAKIKSDGTMKLNLWPNSISMVINVVGIGLSLYYLFVIYQQLH